MSVINFFQFSKGGKLIVYIYERGIVWKRLGTTDLVAPKSHKPINMWYSVYDNKAVMPSTLTC